MKMSNNQDATELSLLVEIREAIKNNNVCLQNMQIILQADRGMMWKILALTIIGSFAIIGVKLAFP
jgi:hypothetical protein